MQMWRTTSLGPTVAKRLEDTWSMSFENITEVLCCYSKSWGRLWKTTPVKEDEIFQMPVFFFPPVGQLEEAMSLQAIGQPSCDFVIAAVLFQGIPSTKLLMLTETLMAAFPPFSILAGVQARTWLRETDKTKRA